jgi:hypothetical protein
LVWVLDQTLGLLQRSARTAEQEEVVKELRSLALLPKPDKAKLESLVHQLETMGSITPGPLQTHRTLKRPGVIEARPVRITLDRELNRLIESIGKKAGAKRTAGKKPTRKLAPKKPTRKVAPKKPARKVAPKKPARKVAPKKPAVTTGGKKPATKVAPRKPAATVGRKKATLKAGGKRTTAVKNVPTKKTRAKVRRGRT